MILSSKWRFCQIVTSWQSWWDNGKMSWPGGSPRRRDLTTPSPERRRLASTWRRWQLTCTWWQLTLHSDCLNPPPHLWWQAPHQNLAWFGGLEVLGSWGLQDSGPPVRDPGRHQGEIFFSFDMKCCSLTYENPFTLVLLCPICLLYCRAVPIFTSWWEATADYSSANESSPFPPMSLP